MSESTLADAIVLAIKTASKETSKIVNEPSKTLADLPSFCGNVSEWIAFRSVYNDTSGLFSNVQNVARIRKALSGEARETCEALIYTETDPLQIMRVLERRFGRPDAIIKQELNKLRRMTPMNGGMGNISSFANKVNNCVAAIRTLNKLSYLSAPEMTDEIVDKFNDILKFKWCEYKDSQNSDEPELVMLSTFLNKIADQCSASMPIEKGGSRNLRPTPERRPRRTNTINTMKYDDNNSNSHTAFQPSNRSTINVKMICPLCNNEHGLPDCGEFVKLNMSEKWDAAKRLRMCFRCLRGRHMQATCRGKPCKICRGGHHRLLHQERTTIEGHEGSAQTTAVVTEHTAVSVNNVNTMRAYLKIVPVELYGPEGSMKVHALLDEGSTVTLIDEQVANRIGAKGRRETLRVSSVGGNEITDENRGNLKLAPQRVERATVAACSHLTDIAENLIYDAAAPCILIGQDNWGLIVSRQIKSGRANQPAASLTQLGWVLHGCCSSLSRPINTVHHLRPSDASDIELNDIVKRHFEIESLGVAPRKPSHDPEEGARINNLLKNGYAEPAPNPSTSERLWYLPHFAVTHPQKKKVRLVFDAAARTNGKCLNDALLTGPDLIRSLLGVLVRFRQGRVAVSADIKEMFLRVKIRKEDRDSLRFLWRNNMHENPQEYRMTSLIFGAASSPCTAIYIKIATPQNLNLSTRRRAKRYD
ncbi:hypothetical protein EVAR_95336_1 [Eumeta japonica]|uniref:Peptidase aspartic putative domain-containing protein n=1 Tax=Eumeta variegata TaxID=151549 RepID=A0A4C1UAL5_EUMVA|nr:hypothetical protein EVAR_95336_1 [Eumeta japonica]